MSQTLTQIAQELIATNKKVQLIYAFNGTGKTRLSREFKELIAPKNIDDPSSAESEPSRNKILYYNAYTEDLFYWDNDLDADADPKLKINLIHLPVGLSNYYKSWGRMVISLLTSNDIRVAKRRQLLIRNMREKPKIRITMRLMLQSLHFLK